jgi:hypothetical protein
MTIVRCAQGADAILTALLGCIPRGSDHGDRPPEGGAVSVCSTKTRTAALSVRTRRYPVRAGCKRIVRSISASSRLMATLRATAMMRSCSQNSSPSVIVVLSLPTRTWRISGDCNRLVMVKV